MRRKKRTPIPGNVADDRGARAFILVMVLIVLAVLAATYWPF